MPEHDRIEAFIRRLYHKGGKKTYTKQEIIAEAKKEIRQDEDYGWLFEQLPDHEYDERMLGDAVGSLLARRG